MGPYCWLAYNILLSSNTTSCVATRLCFKTQAKTKNKIFCWEKNPSYPLFHIEKWVKKRDMLDQRNEKLGFFHCFLELHSDKLACTLIKQKYTITVIFASKEGKEGQKYFFLACEI